MLYLSHVLTLRAKYFFGVQLLYGLAMCIYIYTYIHAYIYNIVAGLASHCHHVLLLFS